MNTEKELRLKDKLDGCEYNTSYNCFDVKMKNGTLKVENCPAFLRDVFLINCKKCKNNITINNARAICDFKEPKKEKTLD